MPRRHDREFELEAVQMASESDFSNNINGMFVFEAIIIDLVRISRKNRLKICILYFGLKISELILKSDFISLTLHLKHDCFYCPPDRLRGQLQKTQKQGS